MSGWACGDSAYPGRPGLVSPVKDKEDKHRVSSADKNVEEKARESHTTFFRQKDGRQVKYFAANEDRAGDQIFMAEEFGKGEKITAQQVRRKCSDKTINSAIARLKKGEDLIELKKRQPKKRRRKN